MGEDIASTLHEADIAIWDPEVEVTISQEIMHDNMDYTPYEGRKVTGWPVITISRGEVVWRDGEVLGKPGRGEFLPCDMPDSAKPKENYVHGFDPSTGNYEG